MNFGSYTNLTDIITAISNKIKGRDKTFNGTHDDWNDLTLAQKAQYDFVAFNDDYDEIIDDTTTANNKVWSSDKTSKSISNSNLLDNPWFTINQRGLSQYTGNGYTVDRWNLPGARLSLNVSDSGITLTYNGSATWGEFHQRIEDKDAILLDGKTITLSVISDGVLYSKTGVYHYDTNEALLSMRFDSNKYIVELRNIPTNTNRLIVRIGSNANSSLTTGVIRAIKLELGEISTLAMDTVPNYATELLKCQRYFIRIGGFNSAFGNGWFTTASLSYIFTKLPTPMRVAPSVSMSGTVYIWSPTKQAGSSYAMSAINTSSYENNGIVILVFNTGGSETVGVNSLAQFRDTASYIDLSADL